MNVAQTVYEALTKSETGWTLEDTLHYRPRLEAAARASTGETRRAINKLVKELYERGTSELHLAFETVADSVYELASLAIDTME